MLLLLGAAACLALLPPTLAVRDRQGPLHGLRPPQGASRRQQKSDPYPCRAGDFLEGRVPAGCAMCSAPLVQHEADVLALHALSPGWTIMEILNPRQTALLDEARTICHECKSGYYLLDVRNPKDAKVVRHQSCVRQVGRKLVVAMRHAESSWNQHLEKWKQLPIVTGPLRYKDAPLSNFGLRQAQRLGKALWTVSGTGVTIANSSWRTDTELDQRNMMVRKALHELYAVPGGLEAAVPVKHRLLSSRGSDVIKGTESGEGSDLEGSTGSTVGDRTESVVSSEDAEAIFFQNLRSAEVLQGVRDSGRGFSLPADHVRLEASLQMAAEGRDPALRALLGRACATTEVVTSNLCRAMDTALIAFLPVFCTCPELGWHVSSNLQETEVNRDCESRLKPCDSTSQSCPKPVVVPKQVEKYKRDAMDDTLEYIKWSYAHADTSRNTQSMEMLSRGRGNHDHRKMMLEEIEWMFERRSTQTFLWGAHSIWLRRFVKYFADFSDPVCRSLARHKLANTAVVAFDVVKFQVATLAVEVKSSAHNSTPSVAGSNHIYLVRNCRTVYLGLARDFQMARPKTWQDPSWFVPSWKDFQDGITAYSVGSAKYKCCCSLPLPDEHWKGNLEEVRRLHAGTCRIAKVAKCGTLDSTRWLQAKTKWHSYEKTYIQKCLSNSTCIPGFACGMPAAPKPPRRQT